MAKPQILEVSEPEKLLKKLVDCIGSLGDIFIAGNSSAEMHCFFCVENSPLHAKDCIYLEIFDYLNRKDANV